jgi:D-sedoheptulose 7-phosphate isomerase
MTTIIAPEARGDVADQAQDYIAAYLDRSAAALARLIESRDLQATIAASAEAIAKALRDGKKLLIAGNGGSAADAQHLAAEFLSRFVADRRPLPAIALTTDTSVLTAIGNDYGFEHLFSRQVRGLGQRGDVFLAISTSGRSPNIIAALDAAREVGVTTLGFTGHSGNDMPGRCDICLRAPSDETAVIQQIHMVAGHMICGLVEQSIAAAGKP